MRRETQVILLSPLFLLSLFLLLLNDFLLKQQFHNFLTGKLSDFAGLFAFPFFFAALLPKRIIAIYISTALFFIFWKSPFSQGLIDFCNSVVYFKVERIVDYSDLFALFVLPLSHLYFGITAKNQNTFEKGFIKRLSFYFVILLSVFTFTATSYVDDRSIDLGKKYIFKGTKEDFDYKLRQLNSISSIDARNTKEMFHNAPIANSISPNEYSYSFTINKSVCESRSLYIYTSIEVENNFVHLNFSSVRFWCKQEPTLEIKQQALEVFEREFISPMNLTLVENSNETNNKK